jgi:tetratricopeptide (TPR) repeat protein
MRKLFQILLILATPLLLTGCIGELMGVVCDFLPDADHCYQGAAIQSGQVEECEKIKGEGFKGSNPPRDKCYLLIAENTGDYSACDQIKGGPMSYSREECIEGAAVKHEDPAGCKKLSGSSFERCKQSVGASITGDKLTAITAEVEEAMSAAGKDPDDADAQKRLADLKAKQKDLFAFATPGAQSQFMKTAREEIMAEVEDDDVKSEISKIFVAYRGENPNADPNQLLKKMEEIRDQQETAKRLDEYANTLMDQLKEGAGEFAGDTMDDLYGEDIEKYKEAMAERGMKYLEEKGGKDLKRGIENLEWLKGKYDKASEQYEAINEKLEKLKKVYDEAAEVYRKIDEINKLVASGRLDIGKAKVLHGAVYLGKGLEYATAYVPVFGSTISTVSKETFDATIKFATKRAERTTAINKCIDDPEHCDTDGISAY